LNGGSVADPNILHLTDLHFGWDEDAAKKAARQLVLDGMIEHIAQLPKEWRPQLICISGDIAWKGRADEYALAKAWLTKLLARLGLGFERVVVCAGNHDVDRGITGRMGRPIDAAEADDILTAPIAHHNLSAFAAFADFCKDSGITPYTFQGEPSYLLGSTVLDGVRFVAFNSAWFCKDKYDKGKLWLGLPLIRLIEAKGDLKPTAGQPTVCLIHHPPDWWHEDETNATTGRPNTLDYIAHRTDMILTGHTHGEVRKADRIAQGALHLTGGAGYSGADHYNSFRLIRIGKKSLQWRSFEYDPRSADSAWRDHREYTVPFVEGPPESSQVALAQQSLAADVTRLAALSREPMEDVSTAVAGLPPLDRAPLIEEIEEHLAVHGVCLAMGESGSGKSAVAKTVGETRYGRVVWLAAESLDAPDAERLRERLGLRNPLGETLASALGTTLVVIDGAERCSDDALRQAARLVKGVRGHPEGGQVRFLVTLQHEFARRVVSRLKEGGLDKVATELIAVERPDEGAVGELLSSVQAISWAALRPELRALLTNLKLLDWAVRAASAGLEFGEGQPATLTALVDRLWGRWVEGDGAAYGRSGLLMKLGELEATTLADGVPRKILEYQEQEVLASLVIAGLVRVRDERVRFAHDLLGDWSRLRLLVGEEPTASAGDRKRAASLRWHRAVRLFGQRLLEQGGNGPMEWRRAIARADDGSDSGRVVSDLLLEAVFFAQNSRDLLEQAWPMLVVDNGKLLDRLLDRFLYVATVPNDRLEEVFKSREEVARFEHLFRLPLGPYWRGVLETLNAHSDGVAVLCPLAGARVARLWLQSVPWTLDKTMRFPWRREAALVALEIARQFRRADSYSSNDGEKMAYEAVLLAAPDLPEEVTSFCREMAERIPLEQTSEKSSEESNEEAIREVTKSEPQRAEFIRRITTPVFRLGPLRPPWPDGPLSRVSDSFRHACLESGAFPVLFHTRPDTAVEVLLAISIEEPQHENPFAFSSHDNFGVEPWHGGYPPLYIRGPFLAMLRDNSSAALTYILKLVNFATQRSAETRHRSPKSEFFEDEPEPEICIDVVGVRKRWLGDNRVYRWHNDWPIESKLITCSLMALEFWLYEELEKGNDVSGLLTRILAESESLAFAGLLVDVGKRYPALFTGPLRPLLAIAPLYHLDIGASLQRRSPSVGLMGWAMRQPEELVKLAHEWHGKPHRKQFLRELVQWLITRGPDMKVFMAEVVAGWRAEIAGDERHHLRYLVEQLNPDNIVETRVDENCVMISVKMPDALERESAECSKQRDEEMLPMLMPMRCRMRLDKNDPVNEGELDEFWERLQQLDAMTPSPNDIHRLNNPIDGVLGGIAVLIVLNRDWFSAQPDRLEWCRQKLHGVCVSPPRGSQFDSADAVATDHWSAFSAETGAVLWAENPADPLARCLVANGVMANRYTTVALTLRRTAAHRERLGDDFCRLVSLAIRFSTVRAVLQWRGSVRLEPGEWGVRAQELHSAFMAGTLSSDFPSLAEENEVALRAIEVVKQEQGREWTRRTKGLVAEEAPVQEDQPSHPRGARPVSLDTRQLVAVLTPLAPRRTSTEAEVEHWGTLLGEMLTLVLATVPRSAARRQGADGLPTDFDGWVFSQIAGILPSVSPLVARRLWQPILDLGTPAHHWVERFFWDWFTDGYQQTPTPEAFTAIWDEMIRFAAEHTRWSADQAPYDLAGIVKELLGCSHGMHTVAKDQAYAAVLGRLTPAFDEARGKWFGMARVVGGFARFAVAPAAAHLLLPAVLWLTKASETVTATKSERDLDDALTTLLHEVWERHRVELAQDGVLMEAFQELLMRLAARSNHAALALRDRVVKALST
jgi:predicted MPP superfamily phosphohydrolase